MENEFNDNYLTHNRKLKIEEYDENGNLIDVAEFDQRDLWDFLIIKNNYYTDIRTARKKDREHFSGKKLELVEKMLHIFSERWFDEDLVQKIDSIFENYTFEQIDFALKFKSRFSNSIHDSFISLEDFARFRQMKFNEVLEWIKTSAGIYYAVSNNGEKGMTYFNKPTKKQAKYQRTSNGKRIVFLSFTDWKEYIINENELL